MQRINVALICFVMLALPLAAQDAGQFSLDAVTQRAIMQYHRLAADFNADAINGYNLAVQSVKMNNEQRSGILPALPMPTPPMLMVVHDDQIAALEQDWINANQYHPVTYEAYVPPTPKPVVTPPRPISPLGPITGPYTRACIPGDTRKDGSKYGAFVKVLTNTPFGYECQWVRN